MTTTPKTEAESLDSARPSTLIPEPDPGMALRGTQADLARQCQVSRQTASQWVKSGKVTVGADGLIDLVAAMRDVVRHTHPGRLRAKVMKQATADHGEMRERIKQLEAELSNASADVDAITRAAVFRTHDESARRLESFIDALCRRLDRIVQARADGNLAEWLDCFAGVHFWGHDLADYADILTDSDGPDPDLAADQALADAIGGADEQALFADLEHPSNPDDGEDQ